MDLDASNNPFPPWSPAYSAGRANIFLLSRQGDADLVLDPADDHEALHTYSLLGIVMYVRNVLLSADPDIG